MNKPLTVLYCPHCGNSSVQTPLVTQSFLSKFYRYSDGEMSKEPSTYTVAKCETCDEILVYIEHDNFLEDSDTVFGDLHYPKQLEFTDAVPNSIREIYKQAALVKQVSPTAYVILARRVLEEICVEQGVVSKNLATALNKLAQDNVIPKTLSDATTLIRLVGNAGAHASSNTITAPQIWAIDDFIKAVVEYIYVAPRKIEEFKKRFQHFKE